MTKNGFGLAKDLRQAAAWYRKAAEKGNSDAQHNLGAMYEHGIGRPVDYREAARWYRPAAEGGDIDALANLGVLDEKGPGIAQDKVLALALYNVAVALDSKGDSQAARNRQGLAKHMPLADVEKALELSKRLLRPDRLPFELNADLRTR